MMNSTTQEDGLPLPETRRSRGSHQKQILFPAEDGISRADLRAYYARIAPQMLPELRDRPLVPRLFPAGIEGEGTFLSGVPAEFPAWIDRVRLPDADGVDTDFIVCNDEGSLLYLVDQGAIEFHVWTSRRDRPDQPDRMIFDLDPDSRQRAVRAGARAVREVLDERGWPSFVRTTGQSGLHVIVPLDRSADHETAYTAAKEIAAVVCQRDPDRFTIDDRPEARGGRLYIGCDRNGYGRTAIASYSVRARPGAPVAAPIEWIELIRRAPRADQYHVRNVFRRLGQKAIPWSALSERLVSLAGQEAILGSDSPSPMAQR